MAALPLRGRPARLLRYVGGLAIGAPASLYAFESLNTPPALPASFSPTSFDAHFAARPFTLFTRLLHTASELLPLLVSQRYLNGVPDDVTYSLERLGPAWIKLGQQLSTRPDLLPQEYVKSLARLRDRCEPFDDDVARDILESAGLEFASPLVRISTASLGQVYRSTIKTPTSLTAVAVKVQRPGLRSPYALDLYCGLLFARFIDATLPLVTKQKAWHVDFVRDFCKASYAELDYTKEAENQKYFKSNLESRFSNVTIPAVHSTHSSPTVLTTTFLTGRPLSDLTPTELKSLIPLGVKVFLYQLLRMGRFHADPHHANLFLTSEGKLGIIDFGLVASITPPEMSAMKDAAKHLFLRDWRSLLLDAKALGFLEDDVPTADLEPIIEQVLTRAVLKPGAIIDRRKSLGEVREQLEVVFFEYPFTVPPFFALVTRGIGVLEGIAAEGDEEFNVFEEAGEEVGAWEEEVPNKF